MSSLSRRDFLSLAGAGVVSLSLGGVLSACTGAAGTSASNATGSTSGVDASKQVIIAMNTGSEPDAGFDPFISWGSGEHVHEPLIQSTLITTDLNMEFVNDLATDYECSSDGLEWVFTIRDDVVFSDGVPLTAEDVAFTINGIKNSPASETDLSMVAEAVATDATKLSIIMEKPFNALLYTLAVIGIVPKHAHGSDYGSNPIGSGRYILEQWDKGQQVILSANPLYYGETPQMERVVIVFVEEDAALAGVNSGQVDIAFTSAIYSNQQVPDYELLSCKSVDCRGISLPVIASGSTREDGEESVPAGNDISADKALRQAINYAVDRDAMVVNVLNGYGEPAYSVCDSMPWSSSDMLVETNVEYARQLLQEGGWTEGADGIIEKNGQRASLNLIYPSNDSTRQALAFEFSNQMREIGIEIQVQGAAWGEIYPRGYSDPVLWGWGSNSPSELYNLIYSSGTGNYACYDSAHLDAYCDKALAQPQVEDSYSYWQKAQWDGQEGIAPEGEASWVWLANIDHLYFKKEALKVADQKIHPHGHGWSLVNNVDTWSWKA